MHFIRYTTEGSGVLNGAETSVARLSIGRHFWRRFHGSLEIGNTYYKALVQEASEFRRNKIEAWEGGFNLGRELGQTTSLYLNYRLQRQFSNNSLCFASSCGTGLLRHVVGIGFNWHGLPIYIR
jgi:hypothetical protein